MKIFSAAQVREWDAFTIRHEPIDSIDLMERAATACFNWIQYRFDSSTPFTIFCGTGNNGGDGLAIGRMLLQAGYAVSIYVLTNTHKSADFNTNLERLAKIQLIPHDISTPDFPGIPTGSVVIDALFGTGLSRPLEGLPAALVNYLDQSSNKIISIDLPSGLFADQPSGDNAIIHASTTLSFQTPKLAFYVASNHAYTGNVQLLDIGLHPDYYHQTTTHFTALDEGEIGSIYRERNPFSHKYSFGHALLLAGSKQMMGAAILCAKACLRSGAGLVTVLTEENTQGVIQTALPEAITTTTRDLEQLLHKKSAIAIGPGMDLSEHNAALLEFVITNFAGGTVIDASALQLLSADINLLLLRKTHPVILTPHAGEFEKLFGKSAGEFDTLHLAVQKSVELGCYILLKGHFTLVACPDGNAFFNTTGNAGMATAGSGDVLTGILAGLLAQGYSERESCLLGAYLHGLAGDEAAKKMSPEAMIAGDIIECIGRAYIKVKKMKTGVL